MVAADANDEKPRTRAVAKHEAQPPVERLAAGPEPAGHSLVDDHDASGRIGAIDGDERAA